jgi:hypothetical protein
MVSLQYVEYLYLLQKEGVEIVFVGDYRQIPNIDNSVMHFRKYRF